MSITVGGLKALPGMRVMARQRNNWKPGIVPSVEVASGFGLAGEKWVATYTVFLDERDAQRRIKRRCVNAGELRVIDGNGTPGE